MADEIKTDAQKALGDVKSEITKLEADEAAAKGWVKAHTMWLVGFICLVVGVIIGHAL
jgi:hypothetical protein